MVTATSKMKVSCGNDTAIVEHSEKIGNTNPTMTETTMTTKTMKMNDNEETAMRGGDSTTCRRERGVDSGGENTQQPTKTTGRNG